MASSPSRGEVALRAAGTGTKATRGRIGRAERAERRPDSCHGHVVAAAGGSREWVRPWSGTSTGKKKAPSLSANGLAGVGAEAGGGGTDGRRRRTSPEESCIYLWQHLVCMHDRPPSAATVVVGSGWLRCVPACGSRRNTCSRPQSTLCLLGLRQKCMNILKMLSTTRWKAGG